LSIARSIKTNPIDQINNTTVTKGQLVAFKVLEGLQSYSTGDQLVGIAMMFLMLCERFKVKPRDILDKSSHVLYDSLLVGKGEHTRAIQNYMNMELK
jgi:hypothetical protein